LLTPSPSPLFRSPDSYVPDATTQLRLDYGGTFSERRDALKCEPARRLTPDRR
jgi:hypothetical protein